MSAILLYADGREPRLNVRPKNGTDFKLAELYELLECQMVEVVEVSDDTILIIDEEGKFKEPLLRNEAATQLVTLFPGDFIAGHALLCSTELLK